MRVPCLWVCMCACVCVGEGCMCVKIKDLVHAKLEATATNIGVHKFLCVRGLGSQLRSFIALSPLFSNPRLSGC